MTKRMQIFLATAALTVAALPFAEAQMGQQRTLTRPEGYREWVYIGTPLTPHDMNGGEAAFPEFHNVYIDPKSFAAYKKTGEFPEGTTIVKELVSVGSKAATSGKGYFMGEFIGLEVAVKDSKKYADSFAWGFYSFGHEYPLADKATPQPKANCATCHQANAAEDMVFTQYYPVARAAKGGN